MENKKITDFIITVLFRGWGQALSMVSLLGVLGFFLAPVMNSNWSFRYSIYVSLGIIAFSFISKIIKQFYCIFLAEDERPQAIRTIQGDGVYKGRKIVIFSNTVNVSKNEILTMYCDSNGARQPICLLRVLDITTHEIITDQYPSDIEPIEHFFNEEARKRATYFTRSIDSLLLENQIIDGGKNNYE